MFARRILPVVVAGTFAAAGLVIPSAALAPVDPAAQGGAGMDFAGVADLPERARVAGARTPAFFAVADDVPTAGGSNAIGDVAVLGNASARLGYAPNVVFDFGYVAGSVLYPGVGVPVPEEPDLVDVAVQGPVEASERVSASVVVPDEALWTFDAQEFTVTSTLPPTVEVNVGLRGHQAEIDLCAGPVVSDYGAYGKVIGEHNHCGGAYVLELEVGDLVHLTGYEAGEYVVAFLMDVPKKNTPVSVLSGADLFLQTCHFSGGKMRLVALAPEA